MVNLSLRDFTMNGEELQNKVKMLNILTIECVFNIKRNFFQSPDFFFNEKGSPGRIYNSYRNFVQISRNALNPVQLPVSSYACFYNQNKI